MPGLRLSRLLRAGALAVACGLSVCAGCGPDDTPDVRDVRDRLAERLPAQARVEGLAVAFDGDSVTCPDDQQLRDGVAFACEIRGVQQGIAVAYAVNVTMTSDSDFRYSLGAVRILEPAR